MTETQSEQPQPILRNSLELDHECTSRIYFDNACDNRTLRLYNMTLTSLNHFNTITSVIAAKQTVIKEAYVLAHLSRRLKVRYFDRSVVMSVVSKFFV